MNMEEKKKQILNKTEYDTDDLVTIVEILRAPGGCPWDREQTHRSIRNDLIEETYEVIEAIDNDDPVLLREELGDLLLQIAMHAQMEREAERCTLDDIANDICRKMIHRHPHVFGDVVANTSGEVLSNWEKIKSVEKSRTTVAAKLRAVPPALPALMRAVKVGKKASMMDFPDRQDAFDKIGEELAEVREALAGDPAALEEELGDLLLTVASLCRLTGVDAERTLNKATDKFISRFAAVEEMALSTGRDLAEMSVEEREDLWQMAKKSAENQKN